MNIKAQAMIEHLVNQGAVIMHSIDDNGQMLYKVTDKLEQVSPELYDQLCDQFEDHILKIVDAGPISMVWRLDGS